MIKVATILSKTTLFEDSSVVLSATLDILDLSEKSSFPAVIITGSLPVKNSEASRGH